MIPHHQKGIVQIVVMVLVAILIVSYLGVDLQQTLSTPQQALSTALLVKNLEFTWSLAVYGWTTYIYTPVMGFFGKSANNLLPEGSNTSGVPLFGNSSSSGGSIFK